MKKFKKLYEEIMNEEGVEDAPNYRESDTQGEACGNCKFSDQIIQGKGGYCTKYNFSFNCGMICDSYESAPEPKLSEDTINEANEFKDVYVTKDKNMIVLLQDNDHVIGDKDYVVQYISKYGNVFRKSFNDINDAKTVYKDLIKSPRNYKTLLDSIIQK